MCVSNSIQRYGLRVYHLQRASVAASQLLASGCDVVARSYEFLEANGRMTAALPDAVKAYSRSPRDYLKPTRPKTALHSNLRRKTNLPFKRVVLDEVQRSTRRGKLGATPLRRGFSPRYSS
jgi:hypothetical protein